MGRDAKREKKRSSYWRRLMQNLEKYVEEAIEVLEAKGLVRKNGKVSLAQNGEVQPVYVFTPLGKWLSKTGQLDRYLWASENDPAS
jgi:hypothetical protein